MFGFPTLSPVVLHWSRLTRILSYFSILSSLTGFNTIINADPLNYSSTKSVSSLLPLQQNSTYCSVYIHVYYFWVSLYSMSATDNYLYCLFITLFLITWYITYFWSDHWLMFLLMNVSSGSVVITLVTLWLKSCIYSFTVFGFVSVMM